MTNGRNSESTRRWELIVLLILFAIVAVSRFKFCEISFWDWDEILYANALHRFNVYEHSPHPPGYPGYVAVTRCFNYFLHNDVKALAVTNAFFGSLLVFPLYFLYRQISSRRVALWATVLSAFNPIIWFYSETAFSDMTSLFWVVTSLALLYRSDDNRSFYFGMLSMGIAMSIRPQNVLFGMFLVPLFLWRKFRRGEIKSAGIGLGLLVAMCVAWFVPLIRSAGGLAQYLESMQLMSKEIGEGDYGYLGLRHQMSLFTFIETKFVLMWGSRRFAWLVMGLTALGMVVYLWRGNSKPFLLLMLGFLPAILVDFLWLLLYYPKYNMPTIVLIAFFVVYALLELWPRFAVWGKLLAPLVVLGFALFLARWTFPAVEHLHTIKSPPAQLFDYIRAHLDPKTDALIVDPMIRILPRYYKLTEFVVISQLDLDNSTIQPIQNLNWYYIGPPQPQPSSVPQVRFHAENPHMARIKGSILDAEVVKTVVLYSNAYDSKSVGWQTYRCLVAPEGYCFLKNNGHANLLYLDTFLLPSSQHTLSVSLDLDGEPLLDTQIGPKNRPNPFFLLKEPRNITQPFSTLTVKTSPPELNNMLVVGAVFWWDMEAAGESQTPVLEFRPEDLSVMGTGWSAPETNDDRTLAWSNGNASVLPVPIRPMGAYELSFRASAVAHSEEPNKPQAVTVCLADMCSPELELASGEGRTCTQLVFSPAHPTGEKADLIFRYRYTYSPITDGVQDTRALGVAFDDIKLKWLGTRLVENPWPPAE